MRILTVDDDQVMLEILSGVMEVAGYNDVTAVPSAAKALEIINQSASPFDCLLLDIQMPVMDGIQLCEKIRDIDGYEETPIIMVTAMSEKSFIDRAFTAGATDYVTKPFDVLELGTRVRMSERLVQNREKVAAKSARLESVQRELNSKRRESHARGLNVDGLAGLVEFESFERTLSSYSKAKLMNLSVYAVKIPQISSIERDLLRSQFEDFFKETTEAIASNLPIDDCHMAYRGNGLFICVGNSRKNALSNISIHNLRTALRSIRVPNYDEEHLDFDVQLGKSKPRVMSSSTPLSMIAEAIKNVDTRRYEHAA